jgi:hypothetical protein
VATSWDDLVGRIRRFVDVGTTKFVVLPLDEPATPAAWTRHLEEGASALLPLET